VLTDEQYAKWLEGAPGGDLVAQGREVALHHACISCHSLDGQSYIGPSWAGLYGSEVKMSDGRVLKADEEYLTRSMMDPQADVVAGYKGVMPSYRGTLAEPEVAALVEFIQSLRSAPIEPGIALPRVQPLSSGQPQEPRP
jgi:cytochrome c oxidase subunit II